MQQNIDSIELLRELNAEEAEYLIAGAYAFAFHGRSRATNDVEQAWATRVESTYGGVPDVSYLESNAPE